jgi:hypothetical protein
MTFPGGAGIFAPAFPRTRHTYATTNSAVVESANVMIAGVTVTKAVGGAGMYGLLANVYDGNDATESEIGGVSYDGNYWAAWQVDLGQSRTIAKWLIYQGYKYSNEVTGTWKLKYSADGETFTTLDDATGLARGGSGYRNVTPTAARYWQVHGNTAGWLELDTWEMWT